MPNVLAGLLIGFLNPSYVAVLGASIGWGVVFLVYSTVTSSPSIAAMVDNLRVGKRWGKPRAWVTVYFIEYTTAAITAAFVGIPVYLFKEWVFS